MFLRKLRIHKDDKEHGYWSLVETVRTADGPRQRTLCYLGELNGSAHARWQKTVEVFNEHGESTQLKLFPSEAEVPDDPNVARVLLKKVRVERTRRFGDCYLGLELWKRLGLDEFFAQHLDGDDADVAWSRVAAVLAINRLCAPGSELAVEHHWYPSTALDDLLHIAKGKINDTRLYRCLDRLLPLKTKIEQHLKQRFGELFQAEFDVLLYDLTSTYVEGAAEENPMIRRGYSRDHRPDCEQLVLALIVNQDGFPFSYELFDGNRADVSTVEAILRTVERKHGKARRVWIFDRGVVSEENLVAIRKRGGQYLVGTPRSKLKQFEQELLKDDFEKIRPEVEVKQMRIPGGEETYILCRTAGRKEKEKAIRSRFVAKIEKALTGLEQRIADGKLKDRGKMFMGLGRIQASHPQVADLYEMALKDTQEGAPGLAAEARAAAMAGGKRGSLSATHQSDSRRCCRSLEKVYAADRSVSRVSHTEERTGHSPALPSTRTTRQGARAGGVSRLCPAGDTEASAETRRFRILAGERAEAARRGVQRGHRAAHTRRSRNLVAAHQQTR